MTTMTEQQVVNFILSGFIPSSNQDVADLQDCILHQSMTFIQSLFIRQDTKECAEKLFRACIMSNDEVDKLVSRADEISKTLAEAKELRRQIKIVESIISNYANEIDCIQKQLKKFHSVEVSWGDYFDK